MGSNLKNRIAKLEKQKSIGKGNAVIFYDPSARTTEGGNTTIEDKIIERIRNEKENGNRGRYMLAPSYTDTESWEKALIEQQRNLKCHSCDSFFVDRSEFFQKKFTIDVISKQEVSNSS